jgi:hypothetical protein
MMRNVMSQTTNNFFDAPIINSYSGIRHEGVKSPYVSRTFTSSERRNKNSALLVEGCAREITGPSGVHDPDRSMLAVLGHAERLVGQCALPDGECWVGRAK